MAFSKIALLLILNVIFFTLVSSNPVPYRKPTSLRVCANVLDLVKVSLPQRSKCCGLIKGLVDLEAAVCLCTALKADLLGLKLNVPISLSVILNQCGKKIALLLILNVIFFTLVSSNPVPYRNPTCKNALKFKVCANVLDLVKVSLPQRSKCCGLIKGLVDLEAAVCLCTALKADLLGLKLNVPISLSVILNQCVLFHEPFKLNNEHEIDATD
ncbi:hypothetical protein HID58_076332 [Brassica napus]|uniref:Bifunctional inhibitor/plant lipid transfer protein/seed storage helical domain-containing protein n=1 Tax=Brassica napus TaxID=3708 RepID=A0ABQ7YQF2_BRANA|nr:hypothetical protein HID58_076332 [Brassica napus]